MRKGKIFGLFLIIIGVICIGISIYTIYINDNKSPKDNPGNDKDAPIIVTHSEEVDVTIKNIFLSTNTTSEKINSVMGDSVISNNYIVLGKDSYLRSIPNTMEDLSKYKEQQEIYAEVVENKYLDGTSYMLEEHGGNLEFKIKPWYFALYSSDIQTLSLKLMTMAGVDFDLVETNYSEYIIYEYKARVKAMMIVDKYLDNYNNQDETLEFVFYYDGDIPGNNQYYSLYLNLVGALSNYVKNDTNKEDRVNKYLNDALILGLVDKNNPLGI